MKSETLVFLKAHILNRQVINEYRKLAASGYDCILFFDNRYEEFPVILGNEGSARIFGRWTRYNLIYEQDYLELNLPNYVMYNRCSEFGKVLWYNADYPFYVIRDRYPSYKFYWQLEYDIYFNSENYNNFFSYYVECSQELLYNYGRSNSSWAWDGHVDWLYDTNSRMMSFFPLSRLSGDAIDYLYKRRLQTGIEFSKFSSDYNSDKRYPYCELFVPTELTLGGFTCLRLDGHRMAWDPADIADFYRECKYMNYDGLLYHPVKNPSFLADIKDKTGMLWP